MLLVLLMINCCQYESLQSVRHIFMKFGDHEIVWKRTMGTEFWLFDEKIVTGGGRKKK